MADTAFLDAISVVLKVLGARFEYFTHHEATDLVRNAGQNVKHHALGNYKLGALCIRTVYKRYLKPTRLNEPRLRFLRVKMETTASTLFELQNLESVFLRIVKPVFPAPTLFVDFWLNVHVHPRTKS